MQLDVEMDWAAAASKAPKSIGGTNGKAYYDNFVAATNETSAIPALNNSFGAERFEIPDPDDPETPYSPNNPTITAGWTLATPTNRAQVGFGFRTFDVKVAADTPIGDYTVPVIWKFTPNGGSSKETVSATIEVPIAIVAPPQNTAGVIPVATKGIVNGDLELGESGWVTGGDGTVNLNREIADNGSGYAQLGGPPAADREPAARIGWLANSSIVVPTDKHSTLRFDQKTTTTESTSKKVAYDQVSVIVNDSAGPHLQAAWTNLDAASDKSGYTTMAIDLDAYEGKTISLTFMLTQDYLNPTTVLLDNINVESTTGVSPAGTLSKSSGFLAGISSDAGKVGSLVAGALITTAFVSKLMLGAGIKTGLAAYVAGLTTFPLITVVVVVAALAGYGAYLAYDAYYKTDESLAVDSSKLTGEAVAAVTNTKNTRQDPRYDYIIALKPTPSSVLTETATAIAAEYSAISTTTETVPTPVEPQYFYTQISGFSAEMTTGTANRMKESALTPDSQILLVGRDTPVTYNSETWPSGPGTAGNIDDDPPSERPIDLLRRDVNALSGTHADLWNLARVTQRNRSPKPATYAPFNTGAGVTAYIVDSGLDAMTPGPAPGTLVMNPEYDDLDGATRIIDAYRVRAPNDQRITDSATRVREMRDYPVTPHGTLVAGVLASNSYGASPGVKVIPVAGRIVTNGVWSVSFSSQVIKALDWVLARESTGLTGPFVLNMSMSFPAATEATILEVHRVLEGISSKGLVTLSAGNQGQDSCLNKATTPLSIENSGVNGVVVVGSTDAGDKSAVTSNSGKCVSLYAPGEKISVPLPVLAAEGYNTGLTSGTSFAAPLAAGVAAQFLARSVTDAGGALTPVQLKQLLVDRATPGAVRSMKSGFGTIKGFPFRPNNMLGTATPPQNRILYAGSDCSRTDPRWTTSKLAARKGIFTLSIPAPTRDPSCPTDTISHGKLTIDIPNSSVNDIQGFTGTLTLMANDENGNPQTITAAVPFTIGAGTARTTIMMGATLVASLTTESLPLESHPRISGEYWVIDVDPDKKYSEIEIRSLKITVVD